MGHIEADQGGFPRDLRLLYPMSDRPAFAERNVPRYTSYPTAPHFSAAVDADTYRQWLAALPAGATLSLYIHVPFCRELCFYCGCTTKAVHRSEPVERYAERLLAEIDLVAGLAPRKVVCLHWGGGTPSMLGATRLDAIVSRLAQRFDLSGLREHAIELDPRRVDRALAGALAAMGVNRASLGVQDFSPTVQRAIGRIQPFDVVEQVVTLLRHAGIDDINIDLMYGLPLQSVRDVTRSAVLATSLNPQRLALFGYAHVPWFKTHQKMIDAAQLPGLAQRIEQSRAAAKVLQELAYKAIGIDHFADPADDLAIAAREGRLHRNFQGYTTDAADALIGLGASSIGRLPQGYVQNAPDLAGYARAVSAGRLATVRGIALSDDDRLRARIIERLMCDLSVDLDAVAGANARRQFGPEIESLAPLAEEGIVAIDGSRISFSADARPFVRLVAAAFDAYLRAGAARHSLAV
jgi:oxygen-independent coproporphyrinogen-3 oxidase